VEARQPNQLARAFSQLKPRRVGALLVVADAAFQAAEVSRLAGEARLPTIDARGLFAEAGGLLAYGPSFVENYRRAATYVDKILKGAKPADLPVEQPAKFELVINLRTAKALGLTIPPSLLQRADHVIE
jgi:putative ABC transport system substrate-binding protein